MKLDGFLPEYNFTEIHKLRVKASPSITFSALKDLMPSELSPLIFLMLNLRELPAILTGRARPTRVEEKPFLSQLYAGGFIPLDETADEIVFGLVGQFWKLTGGEEPSGVTNAESFLAFNRTNFAKVAANLRVQPEKGGTLLSTETRIWAPDPQTRKKFAFYWWLISLGSGWIRVLWLRAIRRRAEKVSGSYGKGELVNHHSPDDGLEVNMDERSWVEKMTYPSGLIKWLYKTPILLYRLGLAFLVGRLFMIMTTVGRKSGQPRRTAIEFHEHKGRRYVFSAWGMKADWYRNIEANPPITIQTWRGAESVLARRITSEVELAKAFDFAMSNQSMRMVMKSAGFGQTLEQFLARKERFVFVTFDPTDQPTPQPLRADLAWVWGLLLPLVLIASTGIVFRVASQWLVKDAAYLLGFGFYWLFWCLLIPGLVFKKPGVSNLLKDRRPLFTRGNWLAGMLWIIVTATALAMYGRDFIHAPLLMIVLAIPLATINGICEELLWRGLYVRAYPGNPWLSMVFPGVSFALWHFVPQTIYPAENQLGFVLSTLFLGLAYGLIAYRTGSAKWTAISHSLSGILALGGYLPSSLLTLMGQV